MLLMIVVIVITYAWHYSKYFTCINLFSPHHAMSQVYYQFHFRKDKQTQKTDHRLGNVELDLFQVCWALEFTFLSPHCTTPLTNTLWTVEFCKAEFGNADLEALNGLSLGHRNNISLCYVLSTLETPHVLQKWRHSPLDQNHFFISAFMRYYRTSWQSETENKKDS